MWAAGAGADHIAARRRLLAAEKELLDHAERVAAARRALPPGPVLPDYTLAEGPRDLASDEPVTPRALGELFGEHGALVVYHLMFAPDADEACPMCSMWVDGFNGVAHHVERRAAFAVVARAPLPKLRAWGRRRGWDRVRLLSGHDSAFGADLAMEGPGGAQRPGLLVFDRAGDRVRHRYTMQASVDPELPERGIDLLSPVWQLLDLVPAGRGDWYAANGYVPAPGR
ncbi:DUF899 domain-containing protein [Actinomadura sp. WMMB 499]|nr:DUF899 domain-containing protein [Actinomadura sp. WMMB 499]